MIALCTRPASAQAVVDEVGVSRGSLYKWKNQLLGHDASASMKRKQDAPASSDQAALEHQLETLYWRANTATTGLDRFRTFQPFVSWASVL